jgi:Beta-galactosidase trimerisation domain
VTLRGYGTLSGTFTSDTIDGLPVSTLRIACEDEPKAQLVQAKFLSDLQVLPGVTAIAIPAGPGGQAKLPGFAADGQGVFLAGRDGRTVTIFAAPNAKVILKLAQSAQFLPGDHNAKPVFTSEVAVPMYLDRWDKYGFRFYYGPYTEPKGPDKKPITDYDPSQDFTFAQKSNHAGLVIWHGPLAVDNAEGITNLNWWDWALKAAQKLELPVGINDGQDRATWAYNRYPDQIIQYQPGFLGGWYGNMNFGEEILSWNAFDAEDQVLAEVQQSLRSLNGYENITSWLEPHEEMGHGVADLMVDYGPVADQGYRKFLQEHYGDVATVSERWYGNDTTLKSWNDIRVPELASFLGWGPEAIDLTGLWRVKYDVPFDSQAGSTTLDDSTWPTVPAPNHAIVKFLPRKPAVFRRHINVDPAWRSAHDKIWLYVWDLNDVRTYDKTPGHDVMVFLNGTLLPEVPRKVTQDHWVALDVSKLLVPGDNLVAVTLPVGMFNYRVYLSPDEPLLYPNLGPGKNAQWVDFHDWNAWTRGLAVRRGAQMIRQVDPNRGIVLMSPDSYLDEISRVAKDYGGDFHNTGYMGGFWCDSLPSVARGLGLPMSVEPGSPAPTALSLKAGMGRWLSEGANGIDYFQHEGDILWNPDIKKCFEDNLSLYDSIGKYHAPTAEVAALYSARNNDLLNFPWYGGVGYGGSNPIHLGSGYYKWNVRAVLRGAYESDGLVESSFARGDAARYKVIIDTNTSMIDEKLLADIEKYVRDGGTFVTYVQTGRHTPTETDTWPIEKLTGYHVTSLGQSTPWQRQQLRWARDQDIFSGDWMNEAESDGLSLKKTAADAHDLAYWKDGSVAIGMRPLGKGMIIQVGCRFTAWGLPDRIDEDIRGYLSKVYGKAHEYGLPATADENIMTPELHATAQLFAQILKWRGVTMIPAQIEPENKDALMRHFVSNNGLYDVWTVWNQSSTRPVSTNIVLSGLTPAWAINIVDGARTAVTGHSLPIRLGPFDTVIYLTPHGTAASAPEQWFNLQRNWWQGTADTGKPLPPLEPKLAVDLTQDWAFRPLDDSQADVSALVDPKLDDSSWTRRELGIFTIPDHPKVRHALFRKTFTVPANWNHGRVSLWLRSWDQTTFLDEGQVYLDGKIIPGVTPGGVAGEEAGGALQGGTTHVLAVEISGKNALVGARGPAWIAYHPEPAARQDLSGDWQTSADGLTFNPPSPLPGPVEMISRRTVTIDAAQATRTVVVHAVADTNLKGVIINGRFVARFHHGLSAEIDLNITPWVKFGQDNELMFVGAGKGTIQELSLEFHEKGTYP